MSNAREVIIYICHNSLPPGMSISALERRASEAAGGTAVALREVPCSGKMDVNYILKAFEGGARGVGVVTCPLGECRLAEGNYRAQVRARHIRRILDEIGLGAERLVLLHCGEGGGRSDLPLRVEEASARIGALEASPMLEPAEAEWAVAK